MKPFTRFNRLDFLALCIYALFLAGCNGQSPAEEIGLSAAISEPADGAQFNQGDLVIFKTDISHPQGASQVVLFANGEAARVDDLNLPIYQGRMQQGWLAALPGTYQFEVLFLSESGQQVVSNTITIVVGGSDAPLSEPTLTSEPLPSETPTLTPSPISPIATADVDANCRFGPSSAYIIRGTLFAAQSAPIVGRLADNSWWVIHLEDIGVDCWVWDDIVTVSGDTSGVPIVTPPSLPTASPTSAAPLAPPAPQAQSPSGNIGCVSSAFLTWSAVSAPSGVDYYEWEVGGDSGTTTGTQVEYFVACATSYEWRVRAVDNLGNEGAWSNSLNFETN